MGVLSKSQAEERTLPEWRLVDTASAAGRDAAHAAALRICALDPRSSLEHERVWLLGPGESRIYLCESDGVAVGFSPFVVHRMSLPLRLGEVKIGAIPVERLSFSVCPLFDPAVAHAEAELTLALLCKLARDLPRDGILFAWGARADTPIYDLLAGESRGQLPFRVLPQGNAYCRRLIDLPPRYEDYFAALGAKTREDLRRHERRLQEATKNTLRIEIYETAEQIPAFLEAATVVSRKSYQWQLLELGLRNPEEQNVRLLGAARSGWLRCYVLFGNDVPLAFMVGFLFNGTYCSEDIGYDPDWHKYSVGNVLHCHVIRDLIRLGGRAKRFDFMYGDNSNKERLSNAARTEGNFYLFPKTARGLAGYAMVALVNRVSEATGRLLERHGLKVKLRRLLRGLARRRVGNQGAGETARPQ